MDHLQHFSLLHFLVPFLCSYLSHDFPLSLIITSSFFIYSFSLLTHKITTAALLPPEGIYILLFVKVDSTLKKKKHTHGRKNIWIQIAFSEEKYKFSIEKTKINKYKHYVQCKKQTKNKNHPYNLQIITTKNINGVLFFQGINGVLIKTYVLIMETFYVWVLHQGL